MRITTRFIEKSTQNLISTCGKVKFYINYFIKSDFIDLVFKYKISKPVKNSFSFLKND